MKALDFWNCDACGMRVYSDPCEHCGWNPYADTDTQINRALERLAALRQRAEKAEARVAELEALLREAAIRIRRTEATCQSEVAIRDNFAVLVRIDAALQEGGKDD